jgi:type I restriction enzyme S subunit
VEGRFFLNDSGLTLSTRKQNGLAQDFLDHLTFYLNDIIYALGKGQAQRNLSVPAFKMLQISFPKSLAEQRRIVAILDQALEGINVAAEFAKRNVRSASEMFESYSNITLSRQKNECWSEKPLGDICEIEHGFAFKSKFFVGEGDHVLLTPGNFQERGGYRDRGAKQKFYEGEIPVGTVLKEGDLLIAMTEQAAGLLGSALIVPGGGRFLHNQRLGRVVARPSVPWVTEFFFRVFNTRYVRKAIHDGATGVKVRHTSPKKVAAVVVSFPQSEVVQRSIARTLDSVERETDRLAYLYKQKLAHLTSMRQAILDQAFAGNL